MQEIHEINLDRKSSIIIKIELKKAFYLFSFYFVL